MSGGDDQIPRKVIERGRPPHRDAAFERDRDTQPVIARAPTPLPVAIDPEPTPPPVMIENVLHQVEARYPTASMPPELVHFRNVIVAAVSNVVLQHVEHQRAREPGHATRVAQLEIWRKEQDAWRLRLTGDWQPAPNTNTPPRDGCLGDVIADVAGIRADVGDTATCKETRLATPLLKSVQKRILAALGVAALSLGGGAYGYLQKHDEGIEAAVRLQTRLERIELVIEKIDHGYAWIIEHVLTLFPSLRPPPADVLPSRSSP